MQKVIEVSQYELERGKPPPSKLHGFVQAKLSVALDNVAKDFSIISELDLELGGWKTVPDLSIFQKMVMDF
jgi:hypothetical protein